jgi:hypothetical protein
MLPEEKAADPRAKGVAVVNDEAPGTERGAFQADARFRSERVGVGMLLPLLLL